MSFAYRLQQILCIVLYGLIVLGAGVRLANAGLACPDWPLCLGQAVPAFNFQIFMEWIHRVIAGSAGIVALVVSISILRSRETQHLKKWAAVCLILFGIQGFLGRQTVLEFLRADTVTAHLIGGYSLFAVNLLILLNWKSGLAPTSLAPSQLRWIFFGLCALALFQAMLGGLVSSHYAGLACGEFPKCQGEWWPTITGTVGFHFVHRLGALTLVLGSFSLALAIRKRVSDLFLRRCAALGVALILLQWVWGISMIFSSVHPALSLAHSATSLAIFTTYFVGAHRAFTR